MITCGLHHDSNYSEKYFTVLDKFMDILISYRQHNVGNKYLFTRVAFPSVFIHDEKELTLGPNSSFN